MGRGSGRSGGGDGGGRPAGVSAPTATVALEVTSVVDAGPGRVLAFSATTTLVDVATGATIPLDVNPARQAVFDAPALGSVLFVDEGAATVAVFDPSTGALVERSTSGPALGALDVPGRFGDLAQGFWVWPPLVEGRHGLSLLWSYEG